jgi:hypothetical protein
MSSLQLRRKSIFSRLQYFDHRTTKTKSLTEDVLVVFERACHFRLKAGKRVVEHACWSADLSAEPDRLLPTQKRAEDHERISSKCTACIGVEAGPVKLVCRSPPQPIRNESRNRAEYNMHHQSPSGRGGLLIPRAFGNAEGWTDCPEIERIECRPVKRTARDGWQAKG